MASHQLFGDFLDDGVDIKLTRLFPELGMKDHVQQQVAKFLRQAIKVAVIDRVEDLIDFFDQHRLERIEILLLVPWTAVRAAQSRHNLDEPLEPFPWGFFAIARHNRIISAVLHSYADESRNL